MTTPNNINLNVNATQPKKELPQVSSRVETLNKNIANTGNTAKVSDSKLQKFNRTLRQTASLSKINNFLSGNSSQTARQTQQLNNLGSTAVKNMDKVNKGLNAINSSGIQIAETFKKIQNPTGFSFMRGGKPIGDLLYPNEARARRALGMLKKQRDIASDISQGNYQKAIRADGSEFYQTADGRSRISTQQYQRFAKNTRAVRFANQDGLSVQERLDPVRQSAGFNITGRQDKILPGTQTYKTQAEALQAEQNLRQQSKMYSARGTAVGRVGNQWGIKDKVTGEPLETFAGSGGRKMATARRAQILDELKMGKQYMKVADTTLSPNQMDLRNKISTLTGMRKPTFISKISEVLGKEEMVGSGQYGVRNSKGKWLNNKFFGGDGAPSKASNYWQGIKRRGEILGFAGGKNLDVGQTFNTQLKKSGWGAFDADGKQIFGHKDKQAVQRYVDGLNKSTKQIGKNTQASRRQGVSFMELTKLMVMFGAAMAIIQLPGQIVGAAMNVVSTGAEREQQLAHVRALSPTTTKPEITQLGLDLYRNMQTYPVEGDTFAASEELASSLATLAPSQATSKLSAEAKTIADYAEVSARYAAATNINIETAVKTMTSLGSATQSTAKELEGYSDILATTIDVGRIDAPRVASIAGENIGYISQTWDNKADYEQQTKELMTLVAASSITLDPGKVPAALRNWLRAIRKPSAGGKEYLRTLETSHGVDLSSSGLKREGFVKWAQTYSNILGPQGERVNSIIENQQAYLQKHHPDLNEEEIRARAATEIFGTIFANVRGATFMRSLGAGPVLENVIVNMITEGVTQKQLDIRTDTMSADQARAGTTMDRVKFMLYNSGGGGGLRELIQEFNTEFNNLMDTEGFETTSIEDKLTMLFDQGFDMLDTYMQTDGFQKLMNIMTSVVTGITEILTTVITTPAVQDAIGEVGWAIGKGIAKGIGRGMADSIPNVLSYVPGLEGKEEGLKFLTSVITNLDKVVGVLTEDDISGVNSPGYEAIGSKHRTWLVEQAVAISDNPDLKTSDKAEKMNELYNQYNLNRQTEEQAYINSFSPVTTPVIGEQQDAHVKAWLASQSQISDVSVPIPTQIPLIDTFPTLNKPQEILNDYGSNTPGYKMIAPKHEAMLKEQTEAITNDSDLSSSEKTTKMNELAQQSNMNRKEEERDYLNNFYSNPDVSTPIEQPYGNIQGWRSEQDQVMNDAPSLLGGNSNAGSHIEIKPEIHIDGEVTEGNVERLINGITSALTEMFEDSEDEHSTISNAHYNIRSGS